jgi:nucleoside-diphosphate-sugar epimerase
MKLLFLGVSSFTGYHFVKKISEKKKNIIYCTLTKKINQYKSIRLKRIRELKRKKNIIFIKETKFGDKSFIKLLSKNKFDTICFHHASTKDYNDDSKFKLNKSLEQNISNINKVFNKINKQTKIIVSNTIFQKIISKKYKAVNKYGISKSITYDKIKNYCNKYNLKYKCIYITNPWGILEEKKLNYYLIYNWLQNKEVYVSHPNYIRDNIYIDKLTNYYLKMIKSKSKKIEYFPSGYCSSNKVFIEALKYQFERFFKKKVKIKYSSQIKYNQPIKRINGKKISRKILIKEDLKKYFNSYQDLI